MSGSRLTTGVGIAVGGVGGAVAALLGAPSHPPPPPLPVAAPMSAPTSSRPSSPSSGTTRAEQAPSGAPASPPGDALMANSAASAASEPPAANGRGAVSGSATSLPPPPLELPASRAGLLKAQLYCDQKKLYDECSRAAESLERGTAGPVDLVQAKRFRRIALTHLVSACEAGDPHACFVMAAKYRAGTELAESTVRAAALEKRGLELCRLRRAPECPAP